MLGFFRLVSAPLYEQLRLILIRTILRDKFSRYYYLVGIEQLGQKKKKVPLFAAPLSDVVPHIILYSPPLPF